MSLRTKLTQNIYLFMNRVYIPEEFFQMNRPIVMHISDTPEEIYPYLYQLIKRLKPEYIIHTGDIVDNLKLENVPKLEEDYHRALEGFIENLEALEVQRIYYISGNHDQTEKIKAFTDKGRVLEDGLIEIEGATFYLNHFFIKASPRADYYLYGHSFQPKSHEIQGERRFNGLEAIRVISLQDREMKSLPYPLGTNGFRKMEQNYRSL